MKNIRQYLCIVLVGTMCFLGLDSQAQIIKGEVFAGGSVSQVDGDFCYGYKRVNPQIGAGALVPVTNWMDVALEVMYNPKGALKKDSIVYNSDESATGTTEGTTGGQDGTASISADDQLMAALRYLS